MHGGAIEAGDRCRRPFLFLFLCFLFFLVSKPPTRTVGRNSPLGTPSCGLLLTPLSKMTQITFVDAATRRPMRKMQGRKPNHDEQGSNKQTTTRRRNRAKPSVDAATHRPELPYPRSEQEFHAGRGKQGHWPRPRRNVQCLWITCG